MFPDVKGRWSEKDVVRMAEAGFMVGYPDGTFKPVQGVTREELASVLARLTFRMCLIDYVLPKILPAVFAVVRGDGGLGTGFYVSPSGHILTAAHVVEGANSFTVVDNGQENKTAVLVKASSIHDIALLKLTDGAPPAWLKVAENPTFYHGKHVAVIGCPKGYIDTVTQGVISHPERPSWPNDIVGVFQTDAPINKGNSGGPVVDGNADVIGIAVWKYAEAGVDNMAFCVRHDVIREFLKGAV